MKQFKLKPEDKQLWLEALKSNQYAINRVQLFDDKTGTCSTLGVAVDLGLALPNPDTFDEVSTDFLPIHIQDDLHETTWFSNDAYDEAIEYIETKL